MQYRLVLLLLSSLAIGVSGCTYIPIKGGSAKDAMHGEPTDAEGQYRLGLRYTVEQPQDYAEAAKWFRKAALQGNQNAQYMLGISYYVGRGVDRDYLQALDSFQKAADQGHARAQYQLGEIYMNGRGVRKEPEWAARWYGKAAEQKHTNAQFSLGVVFARGLGLPVNRVRSCQWLMLAEGLDHITAGTLRKKICSELSGEQHKRAKKLADQWRVRDLPPFQDAPTLRYVQYRLKQLGYDPGYVDGVDGKQTSKAMASYLADMGQTSSTISMESLVKQLRKAG